MTCARRLAERLIVDVTPTSRRPSSTGTPQASPPAPPADRTRDRMFHVKHRVANTSPSRMADAAMWSPLSPPAPTRMFHVKHRHTRPALKVRSCEPGQALIPACMRCRRPKASRCQPARLVSGQAPVDRQLQTGLGSLSVAIRPSRPPVTAPSSPSSRPIEAATRRRTAPNDSLGPSARHMPHVSRETSPLMPLWILGKRSEAGNRVKKTRH